MTSPIESQLISAIRANLPRDTELLDYTGRPCSMSWDDLHAWLIECPGEDEVGGEPRQYRGDLGGSNPTTIKMYSQVKIGEYRADLVVNDTYGVVVVECDGHDFHERTKQQAAYDRERDRHLLARGLVTARFTGSEIVNYPERCCRDLFSILLVQRRIGQALSRNGFYADGRSYRDRPNIGHTRFTDGMTCGYWNPGRDGEST